MDIFLKAEENAALKFRQKFLSALMLGRMGFATAFGLANRLGIAVFLSRNVLAGASVMAVSLMFTVPFGSHNLSFWHGLALNGFAVFTGTLGLGFAHIHRRCLWGDKSKSVSDCIVSSDKFGCYGKRSVFRFLVGGPLGTSFSGNPDTHSPCYHCSAIDRSGLRKVSTWLVA